MTQIPIERLVRLGLCPFDKLSVNVSATLIISLKRVVESLISNGRRALSLIHLRVLFLRASIDTVSHRLSLCFVMSLILTFLSILQIKKVSWGDLKLITSRCGRKCSSPNQHTHRLFVRVGLPCKVLLNQLESAQLIILLLRLGQPIVRDDAGDAIFHLQVQSFFMLVILHVMMVEICHRALNVGSQVSQA